MKAFAARAHSMLRDDRGDATMIEGFIVYLLTTFLILTFLSVFNLLYQQWNIQVVATDAAARFSQTYKFNGVETNEMTGEVDYSELNRMDPYRYLDYIEGPYRYRGETDTRITLRKAIESYVRDRLALTSVARAADSKTPEVTVEFSNDGLGGLRLAVTVKGTYEIPGASALEFVGLPGTVTFTSSVHSKALDLSDYLVTTNYVSSLADRIDSIRVSEPLTSAEQRQIQSNAVRVRNGLRSNIFPGKE